MLNDKTNAVLDPETNEYINVPAWHVNLNRVELDQLL